MSRLSSLLLALLMLFFARAAFAKYTPPDLKGHVRDPGSQMDAAQTAALNAKLEHYREKSGNEIVVFLPMSLDGNAIEDVAFDTFNTWKLGAGKNDNGVLLVIAPIERKVFIATGKGVEGALTDLQSNDIVQKMKPRLRSGEWGLAAIEGSDGIIAALEHGGAASTPAGKHTGPTTSGDVIAIVVLLLIIIGIPLLILIAIARLIGSAFSSNNRSSGGWTSGGSSWGGGGGGYSGGDSGGSSFGSDFSGGGGSTGGGGSGDSF